VTCDYLIIGGGIIGLATARQLSLRHPGASILLLEKEKAAALHQTGRNSGVIHSGVYYRPGSFKARFARAGAASLVDFCREYGIAHEVCGKLIVATREEELARLETLHVRAGENRVPAERISPEQAREREPHVRCVGALHVKTTGIVSYRDVTLEYLRQFEENGGVARFGQRVTGFRAGDRPGFRVVETESDRFTARFVINCAGLHSDRLARSEGRDPGARIVPFRGEYYQLVPGKSDLVKGLIYPVPNPEFPFLGVHLTRMIDGSVHAGPNAVLALAREGYRKTDFNWRDTRETLAYRGFRRLAFQNLGEGMKEIYRSLNKAAFTRSLQELVPDISREDLEPCAAGIRAQALSEGGELVDDFHFVESEGALHVCNAPSPGATASLEIGREIVRRVPDVRPASVPAGPLPCS